MPTPPCPADHTEVSHPNESFLESFDGKGSNNAVYRYIRCVRAPDGEVKAQFCHKSANTWFLQRLDTPMVQVAINTNDPDKFRGLLSSTWQRASKTVGCGSVVTVKKALDPTKLSSTSVTSTKKEDDKYCMKCSHQLKGWAIYCSKCRCKQ